MTATPDEHMIAQMASRHGLPETAVREMLNALRRSGGAMAQFNDPGLGGMGQWSGGMLMIGDMFNDVLKGKVSALVHDLAEHVRSARKPDGNDRTQGEEQVSYRATGSGAGNWWPDGLGAPASTGAQNGLKYAVFPATKRLAIDDGGQVSLYDTGDHRIGGAGQAQGGGSTLSFTSQHGLVRVSDLRKVQQ